MDKNRRKQRKKYIAWGCAAIVVFLLAAMPMVASSNAGAEGPQASILSTEATRRDIGTQIIGGGQLAAEAALEVKIPQEVKLTGYLVGNGDTVSEGDAIATVDKVSVMTAITQVQETLDYLSGKITDAAGETGSTTIKALSGGTVKVVYAQAGETVQDVMLEHGALAVLSLDGLMAVQITRNTPLEVGDTVCVTLSDGSEVDGRVKSNLDGVVTVTISDDGYAVGEKVTVTTEDGGRVGTGTLYIHSPWNATAYSGTVSAVQVSQGDTVWTGSTLMTLSDSGTSAEYQRLIDQRQDYEELMQEPFTLYRTETVTAPCGGIVTGVDENGAYLLDGETENWFASLLSSLTGKTGSGFTACAARVTEVTEDGMTLLRSEDIVTVEDMAALSGCSVRLDQLTEQWHYAGSTTVYTQEENGLLQAAGQAKAGDLVLAVGDESQVRWFVLLDGSIQTQATGLPSGSSGFRAVLLDNDTPAAAILTEALSSGMVGVEYSFTLQATEGVSGTWAAEGLPAGLSLDPATGVITGTPTQEGSYSVTVSFTYADTAAQPKTFPLTISPAPAPETPVYQGYAAQVVAVAEGVMQVKQTAYSYTITDPDNLPTISPSTADMTVEATYISGLIHADSLSAGDILLLVIDESGNLVRLVKQASNPGTGRPGGGEETLPGEGGNMGEGSGMSGGAGGMSGGMSGSGMSGGMSGVSDGTAQQESQLYSLDTLTVASVTSQEHMTLEVTVDELDISQIYVGQEAQITVDALAGEQYAASVTKIAASGENAGGNSKFTVELTLEKSGQMLPGMNAAAAIPLETTVNVLSVPVSALAEEGTKTILYTSYDGESGTLGSPVTVTTGVSDGEYVQILEGLGEGQTCYYAYYDTLVLSNTPKSQGFSFH